MAKLFLRRTLPWSRRLKLYGEDGVAIEGHLRMPTIMPTADDGEIRIGDRSIEIRVQDGDMWLVENEKSLAFARGSAKWTIDHGDQRLVVAQRQLGWTESTVELNGDVVGAVRAQKMARHVVVDLESLRIDLPLQIFVAVAALRGWRETLRAASGPHDTEGVA